MVRRVMKKLTAQQKLFVDEYIKLRCKNMAQAAINAGYSKKSAPSQASQLLKNPKVLRYLEEQKNAIDADLRQEFIFDALEARKTVSYIARLSYCDDAIIVTFPDVPDAHTFGYTKDEALAMAKDVLECWFSDGTPLPSSTRLDEFHRDPTLRYDGEFDGVENSVEFAEALISV